MKTDGRRKVIRKHTEYDEIIGMLVVMITHPEHWKF